jgi:NAD-dependent deacetylase
MNDILKLKQIIDESNNIVIFSGAGLSVPSGIPDFRSANGIYNQKLNNTFSPEEIISHSFFMAHTDIFYEFYFDKMVYLDAKPNVAHTYFAELEKMGKVKAVVTQNIDNLHQLAGSKNVIELHGSIARNYCMNCHKFFDLKDLFNIKDNNGIPRCDKCNGLVKPDVVLYEESLNYDNITSAIDYISKADTLIVVGTSLVVYPAAGFVSYFKGKNLVLLNKSETAMNLNTSLAIHDDIKNIINELKEIK